MELALVALLGGVLALDATSVGQFMLSRPVVAGAVTGWMLGDPALGLLIGTLLELYLLVSFPSGGARFPEGTTATVVAVATAVASDTAGALPIAIAVGLLWGQVGGFSITAPFKGGAAAFASSLDCASERAGAANPLIREGRGWRGLNTDVGAVAGSLGAALAQSGLMASLESARDDAAVRYAVRD